MLNHLYGWFNHSPVFCRKGIQPDTRYGREQVACGSVTMCKLTLFVIMKDGDIDYMGGGKMEMVYQADDEYFEFLNQWVKELHMESSQGFITSTFRTLAGSRCKTRRRQVAGIPPTLVTREFHTLATLSDSPPSKSLMEDATQDKVCG